MYNIANPNLGDIQWLIQACILHANVILEQYDLSLTLILIHLSIWMFLTFVHVQNLIDYVTLHCELRWWGYLRNLH